MKAPRPPLAEEALDRINAGKEPHARVSRDAAYADDGVLVERFALGNGLRVVIWEDHTSPVFSYQTWFRVGSRHEEEGKTGIAHLFEHLMFKRTANTADGEFDQVMEGHGAQTNAATWVDWTYYREKLPSTHVAAPGDPVDAGSNLELVCRMESDRMEHLVLDAVQVEAEREVVKNERLMRVDNDPEGRMYERLYRLAFSTHPYGWPTIGWMADIEAITIEDCLAFYRAYYAPNNAIVVVVGDVDTEAVLAEVSRHYGHLPPQTLPTEDVRVEPPQTAERRETMRLPLAAPKIIYAYHAPAAEDPAHAALEVLNEILAGGESSPLYRRLVTDEELATDVSGWTASWRYPGLYEIGVTLRAGVDVAQVEAALEEELARARDQAMPEREVVKAINGIEAGSLRAAGDTDSRARRLGHAEATLDDFRWYWRHETRLREVTPAQVQAVAHRVLRAENRTTMIGLPSAPEAAVEAALAASGEGAPA